MAGCLGRAVEQRENAEIAYNGISGDFRASRLSFQDVRPVRLTAYRLHLWRTPLIRMGASWTA